MNRLPSYDVRTRKFEGHLYMTLSLAAVALTVITAWNGLQFASVQGEISTEPVSEGVARIELKKEMASTNLTIYQPASAGERSRPNGFAVPKS